MWRKSFNSSCAWNNNNNQYKNDFTRTTMTMETEILDLTDDSDNDNNCNKKFHRNPDSRSRAISYSSPKFYQLLISSLFIAITLLIPSSCDCARILSVSFFSSKSHNIVFQPLLERLVQRGHHLTIISPEEYSISSSRQNYNINGNNNNNNSVLVSGNVRQIIGKKMEYFAPINFIQSRLDSNYLAEPLFFDTIITPICQSYLQMPDIKQLLEDHQNGKQQFDLIIASAMMNECSLGYISQFNNTPFILTIPFSPLAEIAGKFGAPSPTSFVPCPIFSSSLTHSMTLFQRVQNMILSSLVPLGFQWYLYPKVESVYRNILGFQVPSVDEIQRQASLLLMNSHFSINYPRPFLEGMVEVGGLHCRNGRELPKDLKHFLDGSGPEGFIYMSFGSVIKSTSLPDNYRKLFIDAFSQLNQRVLWKWENETITEDLPSNVMISKWVPQQDVLAHSKCKLFITHGGLLSTQEAVYHAVPLVGLPVFADQDWNMAQSESNGFALKLNFQTLTKQDLLNAINKVINKPKYKENVEKLSVIFKDRQVNPLDSAVYWTEYVLRHKGALHLRSPARDLSWIAYYSIDVMLILALCFFCSSYCLYKISAFCYTLCKISLFSRYSSKVKIDCHCQNNNKKGN